MQISFEPHRTASRLKEAWPVIPALLLVLWAFSRAFV